MESVTFKVGDKVKVREWTGAQTGTIVRGLEGTDTMYVVALDGGKKTWFPKCGYENCIYHHDKDMTLITSYTPPNLADTLKESYPHGHPDFIPDMLKIMELHSLKNHDYSSGGDALGNFDRVADLKRLYPGFPWDSPFGVAWGNMLKQFDAVMWGMAKNIEHKVEGLDARLQDIIVYSAIGRLILRRGK